MRLFWATKAKNEKKGKSRQDLLYSIWGSFPGALEISLHTPYPLLGKNSLLVPVWTTGHKASSPVPFLGDLYFTSPQSTESAAHAVSAYSLETRSLTEPRARLAAPFSVGAGDSKSGLHAFTTSTLPTEPPPRFHACSSVESS